MKLCDLLFKFNNNSNMSLFVQNAKSKPSAYVKYDTLEDGSYILEPTNLFNEILHATKTTMTLNKKKEITSCNCGSYCCYAI